jgi:hypothetical protein
MFATTTKNDAVNYVVMLETLVFVSIKKLKRQFSLSRYAETMKKRTVTR